ncbi:MAG: hypothetical protein A2Y77_08880 [Planctomycetes bacterium RBG_13_62_9]|nr:MAG: hypothetical protein A2Y77_08880 [Planctomycetes bacterium RBG_13_62_9]
MPTYPQYEYDASSTNLYRTDAYGGAQADVGSTPVFTATIDLTQKIFAVCELKFDGAGPTDDLKVSLYRSLDDSWDGDELALLAITIDSDGSEDLWSMTIGPDFGPGYYRFALAASGSTDTFDIDFNARLARYTLASE